MEYGRNETKTRSVTTETNLLKMEMVYSRSTIIVVVNYDDYLFQVTSPTRVKVPCDAPPTLASLVVGRDSVRSTIETPSHPPDWGETVDTLLLLLSRVDNPFFVTIIFFYKFTYERNMVLDTFG